MSLRIPKERKEVVIYTRNHKIMGEMYLVADSRLSDELNVRARDFLAVTNASIFTIPGDTLLHQADFVNVNKSAIDVLLTNEDNTSAE